MAVEPNDVDINVINPPTRFRRDGVAVSQKVYDFVCGDLNSDGMMDLAFYGEPRGLYVILQKAAEVSDSGADAPKKLSWRTRKKIKIEDGLPASYSLICAEVNNDGADDLFVVSLDEDAFVHGIIQSCCGGLLGKVIIPKKINKKISA